MRELMTPYAGVYVPRVHAELCSRRVLVSEWVDGVKLTQCSPEQIRELLVDARVRHQNANIR